MEDWIYRNLKMNGNTSISKKTFKRYGGKEKILEDLKEHGLNCSIRESELCGVQFNHSKLKIPKKKVIYIIEVV